MNKDHGIDKVQWNNPVAVPSWNIFRQKVEGDEVLTKLNKGEKQIKQEDKYHEFESHHRSGLYDLQNPQFQNMMQIHCVLL